MSEVILEGYLFQLGDLGMGLRDAGAKKARGIVLERETGEVSVLGLTKEECKAFCGSMNERVQIVIRPLGKSDGRS